MYSPADLPSSTRAAPAKYRMLSEHTAISSRAYESGLPTFVDSSFASSSVCSSIRSASFSSSSCRSAGVVSSHSGSAFLAASTALPTSCSVERGTSAIVSPVAGLTTSIVPPSGESTHSPPTKFLRCDTVTLMVSPSVSPGSSLHPRLCELRCSGGRGDRAPDHACVARQALRDHDRDERQENHDERDDVHDRELLPLAQVVEDEDRQRRLRAGGERRDDDLVEREREREQAAGDERGREHGPDEEAEGLPAVGAEVHRRLDERARRPPQPR